MLTVKVASRQLAVNSIESVLIFLGRLEHIDFLAFRMDIEKLVTSGRKRGGDYCREYYLAFHCLSSLFRMSGGKSG